ncbi:hypothetical protein [Methylobacterium nodulans]|uniref:Lipoprotein n=1 Tax=Methylobacterium nodulans (strain LMG 21967 / CNCM I-2342 / ORS 2060) TaxID=460265 RepID=B8IH82_METNO|nr:hypothetical protein [Methylobacterium nodulans]ACL59774.1 conserved hypothetical protein [Methylobacterium nodulans ORS 2060]
MRTGLVGIALLAGLATAGCTTFGYISHTYASLKPQVVTTGCKDPYEVFDQRQTRRMLIVSNGLREVAGCGLDGADPALTRRQRFSEAATTYLQETDRETCRIIGETVFDDLRTEFVYACAEPIEKPGTKVRRLPGRY